MNNIPNFLVVADRGGAKAYNVNHPDGRGPMPQLIAEFEVEEAHGRFQDKYTDQAGAFPNLGKGGFQEGNSTAERLPLEEENQERALRKLAGHIREIIQEHKPARWAFAAPAEINDAVVQQLDEPSREALTQTVTKDLVKIPVAQLLKHFV